MANSDKVPWLVWTLIVLALGLFVAFVMWWYRRSRVGVEPAASATSRLDEPEIELPVAPATAQPPAIQPAERAAPEQLPAAAPLTALQPADAPAHEPDDLVRIEGIGPRIASILRAADISTFAQLAATDVSRLRELLVAAKLPFINPETWPEQARLAAAGDWDAFEALTRELRGGRRVD